jgi:hypothetical protein
MTKIYKWLLFICHMPLSIYCWHTTITILMSHVAYIKDVVVMGSS